MTMAAEQLAGLDFPTPDPLIEVQRELAALTVAEPPWDYEQALDDAIERVRRELGLVKASKFNAAEDIAKAWEFINDLMFSVISGVFGCVCTPSRAEALK